MASAATKSPSRATASAPWTRNLARAIELVDDPRCPRCLVDAIAGLVLFDLALVVVHSRRAKPLLLHDTFREESARRGLSNYIENTYVLNPVYTAHCNGLKQGVYRIRDLAPDAYLDSEHYRNFKIRRLATEEIGYVTDSWPAGMEELVLAIRLQDGRLGEISLSRAVVRGGFSETAIAVLRGQIEVIAATFRQFWRHSHAKIARPSLSQPVDEMLERFGEARLTSREQQVAHHVLKGHSSDSISRRLGISVTTVKTHRKNLYAKLGIATQQELFSRFLETLSAAPPSARIGQERDGVDRRPA